jgi:hypothetical protein
MKSDDVIQEVECFLEMDNEDEEQEFNVQVDVQDNGDCITITVRL